VAAAGCQPGRFIPYIQPYEFEALLFSDVPTLTRVEPGWRRQAMHWRRRVRWPNRPNTLMIGLKPTSCTSGARIEKPQLSQAQAWSHRCPKIGLAKIGRVCVLCRMAGTNQGVGTAMMNEQQLEDLCIGWFQETGWQFVHGPEIAPDGSSPERADYRQVILLDRLLAALTINLHIPIAALEQAVHIVQTISEPQAVVRNLNFTGCCYLA
jgi:predicted RNA-binding Zn-ribbon protein involved in translation (DUF1610 family)